MKLIFIFLTYFGLVSASNAQWTQTGPSDAAPQRIVRLDTTLFSLNSYGIYKSNLSGVNWTRVPNSPAVNYGELIVSNGILIANTNNGIFRSLDSSRTWEFSNNGYSSTGSWHAKSLIRMPNGKLLALNSQQYIYESFNDGQSWSAGPVLSSVGREFAFDTVNQVLIASGNGLKVSYDLGQSWADSNAVWGTAGYYGISFCNGHWFCFSGANGAAVMYSYANTNNWVQAAFPAGVNAIENLVVSGNRLFGNSLIGLLEFNFFTGAFYLSSINANNQVKLSGTSGQSYFGFLGVGFPESQRPFKTDNYGQNWMPLKGIHGSSTDRFTRSDFLAMSGYGGLYLEYGTTNFQYQIDNAANFSTSSLYINSSKIFQNKTYAATSRGVAKSEDYGQTWMLLNNGLPPYVGGNSPVYDVEVFGDTIVAATMNGIYVSINDGASFSMANFPGAIVVWDLLYHHQKLYCSGWSKLMVSSDRGLNWTQFGSQIDQFGKLAACGNVIYTGSRDSVYMTIDSIGITHNISGTIDSLINGGLPVSVACIDSLFFVSTMASGVQKMNVDNPGFYQNISENLPRLETPTGGSFYNYLLHSDLIVHEGRLWLGTNGLGCFIKPLSDFGYPPPEPESMAENLMDNGVDFIVYPNPARSEINLQFAENFVGSIVVNDISGRIILKQVNSQASSKVQIPIEQLSKGIYFVYCLNSKGRTITRKFIKQ